MTILDALEDPNLFAPLFRPWAMLRKILDEPIECEPVQEAGRRGYRFRGTLTFKRLLPGGVLTSLSGSNGTDTHRPTSWLDVPFEGLALAA
jgi:hypothetical protein